MIKIAKFALITIDKMQQYYIISFGLAIINQKFNFAKLLQSVSGDFLWSWEAR